VGVDGALRALDPRRVRVACGCRCRLRGWRCALNTIRFANRPAAYHVILGVPSFLVFVGLGIAASLPHNPYRWWEVALLWVNGAGAVFHLVCFVRARHRQGGLP